MQSKRTPRILIVNPYGIGDVLFTTPLIRALRKSYPNAYLAILLGSRTQDILKNNPYIDTLYSYNKDHIRSLGYFKKILYGLRVFFKVDKHNFDIFIDLSNTDEYAFFAKYAWGIPVRIGFQYKRRGRFLNHKIKIKNGFDQMHVADHYKTLLSFLDLNMSDSERKLDYFVDKTEAPWLKKLFKAHNIEPHHKKIVLLPGGGASWGEKATMRYWPAQHYAQLADKLAEKYQAKIIISGSPAESELCESLSRSMKHAAINLSGKTTLDQLAMLLKHCDLLIGSESGPLHLGTALNINTIPIYGPVDEKSYGPYSSSQKQRPIFKTLGCRPCYQNFRTPLCNNQLCLADISPAMVLNHIAEKPL